MPSDDKLARKKSIKEDDLIGLPLFCSEQSWNADISRWCGNRMDELHLEGKVTIAASSPDLMEAFIEAGDLIILGNRFESHFQEELMPVADKVEGCLNKAAKEQKLDMIFLMLTNFSENITTLLCSDDNARELAAEAFQLPNGTGTIVLKNILSRKKQFLPPFAEILHSRD